MKFPQTATLARLIEQGESLRPLPVDSILAQLRHLHANANQPSSATLARLNLRRQLTFEWEGATGEPGQWANEVLSVVQEYYDWVLRHDNQVEAEGKPLPSSLEDQPKAESTLPPKEFWDEELREQAEYQEEWLKKNGAKMDEIFAAVREGRPARLEQFRNKSETEPESNNPRDDLDEDDGLENSSSSGV